MSSCFKAYDVRGRLPEELNEELARKIGRAYALVTGAKRVAVGRDARLSSPSICQSLSAGLNEAGVEVLDLGLCGTENVYFAAVHLKLDGGIMVTASHNPADYNGMKFVGPSAVPLSAAQLREVEANIDTPVPTCAAGQSQPIDLWEPYLELLKRLVPPESLAPVKVVCDGGNGAVGPLLSKLALCYPSLDIVAINGEPDGTFPNGVPNPLLPEKRHVTSAAVIAQGAHLGAAWDGDYDRCFFYDEKGDFVESYYLIATFAELFLKDEPGSKILYDPRLTWNTIERVKELGGTPQICRTGHVYFKEAMASSNAVYGGEMSGHHYFREFGNCDTGILPFLFLLKVLNQSGSTLSELVAAAKAAHPISGEINQSVDNAETSIERVRGHYLEQATAESSLDGLSLEFPSWRFNLRRSNTEPLLRLNVEGLTTDEVKSRTQEILDLINS